jgi:predicted RNA-binding Zn ribbon-like protein
MQVTEHRFEPRDLIGGHVVLDLVNTVTARNTVPVDWLDGYARLLEWAHLSGSFEPGALDSLARASTADTPGADRALKRLRSLREVLLEAFTAQIERRALPATIVAEIEQQWKDAVAHARFDGDGGGLRLQLSVERSDLDYLRHELTLRAVQLLEHLPVERARVCPGPHCGWLFVDSSRGGHRRWCDMATCGNLVKGRRHYLLRRGRTQTRNNERRSSSH